MGARGVVSVIENVFSNGSDSCSFNDTSDAFAGSSHADCQMISWSTSQIDRELLCEVLTIGGVPIGVNL